MPPKPRKTLADLPDLAAEWHPTKNGDLLPTDVTPGSGKKIWWKCKEGPDHEWTAAVYSRAKGADCPFCAGRSASATNSLAALHPELAAEWHPTKNGDLLPTGVPAGSAKKIWWKCADGPDHEWRSEVRGRTKGGGCPFCRGLRVSVTNSFAVLHPGLAVGWHPTKNGDLTPDSVSAGSNRAVWWKCKEAPDHEWRTRVVHRTRADSGCPFCAGQQASVTNSLQSRFPALAEEWHPTRNGDLTPTDVPVGSNRQVWWKCAAGPDHEWRTRVVHRTREGSGCPFCAGQKVSVTNSLASHYPDLAAEWHPTKNVRLEPKDVTAGSSKTTWWKCAKGPDHEWEAAVSDRAKRGRGCPFCAGKQASVTNSLAALHPGVSAEWHPTKNGDLRPSDLTPGSKEKVWWRCGEDHVWQATVYHRAGAGSGCPTCNIGWTTESVRGFVKSLLPHLPALSPSELFVIFQQSGLLGTQGRSRSFVKALSTGRFPSEELTRFAESEPSLVDRFLQGELGTLEENESILTDAVVEPAVDANSEQAEPELPRASISEALGVLDSGLVATSADQEAVEFLIASAKEKLWHHAFSDEADAVAQAQDYRGGSYASAVRDDFLDEYRAASRMEVPTGYSFAVRGQPANPNLMQRLIAVRMRDNKRIGNWSGTGAGKTLSAVLASRVIDAQLTLICCPNPVVDGWAREITLAFSDAAVACKDWAPKWDSRAKHRYLILNYEQFQQADSSNRVAELLSREQIDFVVIDEIHFTKQRVAENTSQRKKLIGSLISAAGAKNPNLRVLGMSATPVINNLYEGRSLIEMVSGYEHEDLDTRATVANAMRVHQRLTTLGIRYKPRYSDTTHLAVSRENADCSEHLDEIRELSDAGSPLALEQVLTKVRLPIIINSIVPKTLIYSHYVEGIVDQLQEAIQDAGWSVGLYTGQDKRGLDGFIDGDLDVLIGSSAIGTGVDRLQEVCSRLAINALPWTNAAWEQLLGRVYRQGQMASRVDVIVPATFAEVGGERWSYDDSKWDRLQYKKSLADAAVDGVVPEGQLRSPDQAFRDVMAWLQRLDDRGVVEISRRPIIVPLSSVETEVERRIAKYGEFSSLNRRWNATRSSKLHERLSGNPEEWEHYHTLYREARESWEVVPYEEVIRWLESREGKVVGDFGCGEALIADAVSHRHEVHSFDHVAINASVVACDMAHTPLDDQILDVAVFCLSLMGANFDDYIREAHRTLKVDGFLHIWEATSRLKDPGTFAESLKAFGFEMTTVEHRSVFTHVSAVRGDRDPEDDAAIHVRQPAAGSGVRHRCLRARAIHRADLWHGAGAGAAPAAARIVARAEPTGSTSLLLDPRTIGLGM